MSGLWRAVAFNRTVIPTPQSYTVVAGIGLVAGVAWRLLLGWPWWLGPIGFVVVSWVAALATAFRTPQRAQTIEAVHDQLRPGGASDRHRERTRRSLDQLSFAPVGLVVHPESPWLGETGGPPGRITRITIIYGDPQQRGGSIC